MRRSRFTLRSLMVAVAITGLATFLWLRSADFAAKAYEHNERRRFHVLRLIPPSTPRFFGAPDPFSAQYVSFHKQWTRYEDRLFRKYRFAAFLPWLPVSREEPAPLDPTSDGDGDGTLVVPMKTKVNAPPWIWLYFWYWMFLA